MGIISNEEKAATGRQLKVYHEQCLAAIEQLKSNKASIENQFEAMKLNTDYTKEDCDEVGVLIKNIEDKITALI